jgi:hypothetical protein
VEQAPAPVTKAPAESEPGRGGRVHHRLLGHRDRRMEARIATRSTEYLRYWNENERLAPYRLQNEFRDLWPEFETP